MGICGCPNIVLRNGIKFDAGRGDQNISVNIPVRLIPTTAMSPMARLCRSTTNFQRREMCLLRLRNLFCLDKVTASWQSLYIDWCCFYYFVKNSLVAWWKLHVLESFLLDSWISVVFLKYFFLCVCMCKVSHKAFLPPLSTMLLCLVVSIPLVYWLSMCACVCVLLYVYVKM